MTHHVCKSSNSMASAFVFVLVGPFPNIVVDTVSPQLTFSASNFLEILFKKWTNLDTNLPCKNKKVNYWCSTKSPCSIFAL